MNDTAKTVEAAIIMAMTAVRLDMTQCISGFREMHIPCRHVPPEAADGRRWLSGGSRRNPGLSDFHFLLRCARTSGVRMRAAPPEMETKPMEIKNVLKVLQALALVASITKTFLAIAKEVEEMIREHKHHNG